MQLDGDVLVQTMDEVQRKFSYDTPCSYQL